MDAEKKAYASVKDFDVAARIKKAAQDSAVTLARLSVEDEIGPALIDGQPAGDPQEQITKAAETAKAYLPFIQLASDLGCRAVDFPLKVGGGYEESKKRAATAIAAIGTMMAEKIAEKNLDNVALLFRNGTTSPRTATGSRR